MSGNTLKSITVRVINNTSVALEVSCKGKTAWLKKDCIEYDRDTIAVGKDVVLHVPQWHLDTQGLAL